MKKGTIGVMERYAEIEALARIIYRTHDCIVPDTAPENVMRDSRHPTEKGCYLVAAEIIDRYFK